MFLANQPLDTDTDIGHSDLCLQMSPQLYAFTIYSVDVVYFAGRVMLNIVELGEKRRKKLRRRILMSSVRNVYMKPVGFILWQIQILVQLHLQFVRQ